jgi:hypothetical protein
MTVTAQPYGRDVAMRISERGARLDHGRRATGARLLGEACVRRLITERGSLLDDQNYGLPIEQFLSKAADATFLASIPGQIRNELKKDQRIDTVEVAVALDKSRAPVLSMTLTVTVTGVETGPFDFVLSVDEVSVKVLKLPEAA